MMKKALTIISMLLAQLCTAQQNMVPNGDFETYSSCPTTFSQTTNCTGWSSWTNGTSDYFNVCGSGNVAVPVNTFGYQQPASGNGYVGGYGTMGNASSYREYVTRAITPLTPGLIYEVSLSVSLANNYRVGTNDIGMYLFINGPTFVATYGTPAITPQIDFTGTTIITDTANWIRLTANFYADSAYDHIAIGAFKTSTTGGLTNPSTGGTTYYYYDSVVIRIADSLFAVFSDTSKCAGDTIKVPYISTKKKQSNNVFTLQLSNASGSFASPVSLGTIASDTSGIFTVVIPANTPTGTGYKIRVMASNFADTSEPTNPIKIGGGIVKPDANNNSPVCNNDTLKLTATTSTSGVTWSWTGPTSFTSTLQNPTIPNPVPAKGGNYIVTATLYGCVAKDTTNAIVYSGSGPTGTLATTNAPLCMDDTLKLFGTSNGSGNTYSWTGPNSFTSNIQNPVLANSTVAMSGDYVVYASNGNCIARDTVTVLVKQRPQAVTAGYNAPVCTGETIVFSGSSSTGGVTWSWTGPNSFSSSSQNPTIGGSSSVHNGDYILTATLNGCSAKDTATVSVKPLPVKPVATVNGPVCAGETLNLGATTSTGSVTWGWTGPNSYSAATQNTSITNTTTTMSGDYIVTATLNGCSTRDTVTATVKPLPLAVTLSGSTPRCAGDTVYLGMTNSTTGSNYSWTGPNSFSSSIQNTFVANSTTAATGWYKGTVNLNGCLYKDSISITVYPIPAAPSATHGSPLCAGETLQLSAGTIANAAYSWTGPNNYSSSIQNASRPVMQFGDTGMYYVRATVNGCTSAAGSTRVVLNPVPFVVILASPGDSICVGQTASFTAYPNNHGGTPGYQWYINGVPTGSTGTTYSSATLNHMDIVSCNMTENTKCSVPYTDPSNDVEMKVLPWLAPSVSIAASTTQPLKENEYITFTATPTNAGAIPKYQWKRNGQNIVGATGAVWSANTLNDNDDICVEVISTYKCPQPLTALSNCIKVKVLSGVEDMAGNSRLMLYPNPNKGSFTISGRIATHKPVNLSIVNALGQEVHTQSATTDNGQLEAQVETRGLAAGVYMLRLQNEELNMNLKFRIQ